MKSKFIQFIILLFCASDSFTQTLPVDSLIKPLRWRNIGPANQGGRIVDIESLDNDYRKVWLATGSGGVWYSENAGTTWTSIFDNYETASIGDIAVFQPNPNIIWVGTGEVNSRNSVSWGNGIYKSVDGGKTFINVGLTKTHHIARIVLDPNNPEVVYVATMGHLWGHNEERGLYKTTDGGKSWKLLSNGVPVNDKEGCIDVVMDPVNSSTLFAAYYYRLRNPYHFHGGSDKGGIYKSTNGGESWKKLSNGLPGDSTGRIGLAISKSEPNVVMAIVEAKRTDDLKIPGSGVYRSEDGGENWKYLNTYNNRPFYYSQIRIHPNNSKNVYVLTTPFMVSKDGGNTFKNGSPDEEIHGDFHAMWIDPKFGDRYYIGADKGASLTHDGGNKFILFDNLSIAQYYRIAVDMNTPYRIYGGLQDNGFYSTESFSRDARGILNDVNWKVHWGDGQYAAVNPQNNKEVYTSSENGTIYKLNPATHDLKNITPTIFNTTNAKQLVQKNSGQPFYRFNWSAPFFLSTHDNKTLYMGSQYVLKSSNSGKSWTIISPDLSSRDSTKIKTGVSGGLTPDNTGAENYGTVVSLSQSILDKNILYAGTDEGNLFGTKDEGKSWQKLNTDWSKDLEGLWIDRVIASVHDKQIAYATIDGHRSNVFLPIILITTNGGKNWLAINNNLPKGEVVRSFIEDPENQNMLFAGTETGVWFTMDRGNKWYRLNKNMPTVSVYDLKIHPKERDLIAATHGRGLWIMDDISCLQQMASSMELRKLWLYDQKPKVLWANTSRGGQRGHFLFAGENPPGINNTSSIPRARTSQSTFITCYINDEVNREINITISDPVRKVKRSIDTTLTSGIHRIEWDLQFESPMLSDKEIKLIDSLINSVRGSERASLTAVRRLSQAKNSFDQRQQVLRLAETNPGIPIPDKLLPVHAIPGVYNIELKSGTTILRKNLVIKKEPLN